ncbi:uncharacterized protein LOC128734778 [Sabethes cyaneus]|uniref:uncharacterized protein LOC128734778 n=1 Tax=Sabethes cyaneus TaxID=53552 RepID=UPI00237D3AC2|nr:uncharacterized protein LOC128734778 [Sabethes cyaneus]
MASTSLLSSGPKARGPIRPNMNSVGNEQGLESQTQQETKDAKLIQDDPANSLDATSESVEEDESLDNDNENSFENSAIIKEGSVPPSDSDEQTKNSNLPTRQNQSEKDEIPISTFGYYSAWLLLAMIFTLIAIWIGFFNLKWGTTSVTKTPEVRQCAGLLDLNSKYPNVDQLSWSLLNVSVNRAIYREPGEPATFIFLHNSSFAETSLLEDLISVTSECFGEGHNPIKLESQYFRQPDIVADKNLFFAEYLNKLEAQGILVVQDLDKIPANVAQVFFTICDSVEPLVNKAIIFFTINLSQHTVDAKYSPTGIAESILKEQWENDLNANDLYPLMNRLLENVLVID